MSGTVADERTIRFGGTETPHRYLFELTGGRLCLDLANTIDERETDHPRELLRSYADVIDWARQAGVLTKKEVEEVREQVAAKPAAAARALRSLIQAREVLFQIFSAVAARHAAPAAQLEILNELITDALPRRRLAATHGSFDWMWRPSTRTDLNRPLWAAVLSAADLLISPGDLDRVRRCDGVGCAWLFIDTSKNRSRRWCDMSVCGNRAKARRHRGSLA